MTDQMVIFAVAAYLYATQKGLSAEQAAKTAWGLWAEVKKKIPAATLSAAKARKRR